ncbi:hypothetical protein ACIGXM_24060 [Kitasatospora sp. NPDC052896]|uniref:hypothetical protein n=1 Tax=Kitasatospora sp. NPDC052896 TaxID=3364061 RepID=UPI0037CAA594
MQRDLIDGVPVFWEPAPGGEAGPGPLEAALLFGCGVRDETFRTRGVTRLVARRVLGALPRLGCRQHATVTLELAEFGCAGRPEQVAGFLEGVCRALAEPSAGRAGRAGDALPHPTVGALLAHRYGIQGPGLALYPECGGIPAAAVRDRVRRYFHAGNAVLVLTGPPPEGLRLPLPPGRRPVLGAAEPVLPAGPSWRAAGVSGAGLAIRVELADAAVRLAMTVLAGRLRVALGDRVEQESVLTGPGWGERIVHLSGADPGLAELLWTEARRLAADGPGAAELAERLARAADRPLDPAEPFARAHAELLGWRHRSPEEELDALKELTADRVREAFAGALGGALLVVPRGAGSGLAAAGLPAHRCGAHRTPPGAGRQLRPRRRDRLLSGAAREARLWVTDRGLVLRSPGGELCELPYSSVVGVEVRGPGRVVYGRDGCVIPVLPGLFAGSGPAVRAVDAAVPAGLRFTASVSGRPPGAAQGTPTRAESLSVVGRRSAPSGRPR